MCAYEQFTHLATRGEPGQRRDDRVGLVGLAAVEQVSGEGVENVRANPLVPVGHSAAAAGGLGEPSVGELVLAARGAQQSQTARGHALPARVVESAGEVPGAFESVGGMPTIAGSEVELGEQRLGPRQERHPPFLVDELDRPVECGGRLARFTAQ